MLFRGVCDNLRHMKFIVTKEVGRLARWLRILGFDAVYYDQDNTARVLLLALREQRIVVTRNKLLFDTISAKAVYLTQEKVEEQLTAVIEKLGIGIDEEKMFSRCVLCNKVLVPVDKQSIKERVPAYVYKTQDAFMECSRCLRVYWPGTHWGNIRKALKGLNLV
jgi:uncharacterized protein with PIN domain